MVSGKQGDGDGMTASAGHRQRINELLFSYWDSSREGKAYPSEHDMDPEEIAEIWDACFLVQVVGDGPKNYRYAYLGTSIVEAFGDDLTGEGVCEKLLFTEDRSLYNKLEEVRNTGKPVTDESEFVNAKKMLIKYRSCILPLGPEPGVVDYIIGGMKWKAF